MIAPRPLSALPRLAPSVPKSRAHLFALPFAFSFALALALTLPLSAASSPPSAPPPPRILTSFLPVHSLVASIASPPATVENWLPAGADPHEFQFSPRDLRRLREARLLVVAGLGLEGWKESTLREATRNPDLRLVEVGRSLAPSDLIVDLQPHRHGEAADAGEDHAHPPEPGTPPNPHFWHDPRLMARAATNVLQALIDADPARRETYQRQTDDFVARLRKLDQEFEQQLAPLRGAAFVTYHNAFPYLARRYGLRPVGVVVPNPALEPTARELSELSARIRQSGARVLFVDGQAPPLARRLAGDLGLRLAKLETLEVGGFSPTAYEEGMRRNLATLRQSLATSSSP